MKTEELIKSLSLPSFLCRGIDHTLYDVQYFQAHRPMPRNDIYCFSIPKRGNSQIGNNEEVCYEKTEMQTNLDHAASLSRGTWFIIESIQILPTIPSTLRFVPIQKDGKGYSTAHPLTGIAVDNDKVKELSRLISKSLKMELRIGVNLYENGLIEDWPVGIDEETEAKLRGELLAKGFALKRKLSEPRVIEPGRNFNIRLSFLRDIDAAYDFELKVMLQGIMLYDVS